jgi:hypothetical protein
MRYLFSLLFLSYLLPAAAQQTQPLRLFVADNTRRPIPGAALRLSLRTDTTQRTYAIADSVGATYLTLQTGAAYDLRITAVGMKPLQRVLRPQAAQTTVRFTLETDTKTLDAVAVTAKKPLMRQEDDKTIVDPTPIADISTNAFELLEKTPGLFTDQDGNVYLTSATPATIYINGREQKMGAADLATLLRSLPPHSIERIEIMRTPSARYDASGGGGALNIVLKKGVKLGRTGSFTASANQGRFGNQSIGANLNNADGGRSTYLNLNYNRTNSYDLLTTTRQLTGGRDIAQTAYTRYPGEALYAAYGLGYTPANRLTLNLDGRGSYGQNNSESGNETLIRQREAGTLLGQTTNDLQNRNATLTLTQDVSAQLKLDTLGSEWTFDGSYQYRAANGMQAYQTRAVLPTPNTLLGDGDIATRRHGIQLQTDLRLKLPHKLTLETGLKTSLLWFDSRTVFGQILNSGPRQPDAFRTNTFDYQEAIHAGYVQASRALPGKFLLKVGLRAENTNMDGQQRIPSDTTFRVRRTDFFPYVYLSRPIMSISGFELRSYLVYRRSIARPAYDYLNPFARFVDPFLYETGNPALQPQFTETLEANISVDEMPILAIGRNNIQNIFSSVLYQDPRNAAITYRTYDNLGQNRETYARIMAGNPPGGRFFGVVAVQYTHTDYDGRYEGQPLTFSRGSWRFFTYQQLKLDGRSTLTVRGFYLRGGQQQFYALGDFGSLSADVNRYFLNRKLIASLTVSDILYTNRNTFNLDQGNITATGDRRADTRRVGLSLRYNFGLKKRDDRTNMFNVPTE